MSDERRPLIPSRVLLMGEEKIPYEVIRRLSDEHIRTFLREPDPYLWPEEMKELRSYLPKEEIIHWEVRNALKDHRVSVKEFLSSWAREAWGSLMGSDYLRTTSPGLIVEEIKEYFGDLLMEVLDENSLDCGYRGHKG